MSTVALVTAAAARHLDEDLPPLLDAFERAGAPADVVVWDDPDVDWSSYSLAVVRSTWDYVPRRAEFLAWATMVEHFTDLANPADLLAWSTDKGYLADLAGHGIEVSPPPSCAREPRSRPRWPSWPSVTSS
jgi:hypothetical protein